MNSIYYRAILTVLTARSERQNMIRNAVIFSITVLMVSGNVFSQQKQASGSADETLPNILWITCEDMSPDIPSFGDSTIVTPHLSRLASEGIRFTRAYTTAGVCAPSRSAIITGMYASSIGAQNMRTGSGASAGLIDYEAVPPPAVKCFTEYLRARGYYCSNNAKTDYQFGAPFTAWDESGNQAHWRNRPKGKPFFAVMNIMRTHESQLWVHAKKPLRVDPDKVAVPPYYPDNKVVRTDIARYYDNIMVMDSTVGVILKQLGEDGLLEKTIIFFFSDHGAGLPWYKREIYNRGLHVPLIVRFPDMQNAGTTNDKLISFIDLAPTVLSLTHTSIPKHMQGQAFLGDQKAPQPRTYIFAARDRMDELNDMARSVKDQRYTYVRNYQPEKPYYQDLPYRKQMAMMQEILRLRNEGSLSGYTLKWFEKKAPEELFDTEKDPFELNNLAADPVYRSELEKFSSVLAAWSIDTGDKGFMPERDLIEMMWPENKQPVTSAPAGDVISKNKKAVVIRMRCDTEGASIGYRFSKNESWNLYTAPINVPANTEVWARAIRYGYQVSDEVMVNIKK